MSNRRPAPSPPTPAATRCRRTASRWAPGTNF